MDWLVALVLLAVAYFFADSGALFAAFLCVVALFLYLAAQKQSAPAAGGQVVGRTEDGRPIIVKSNAAKIPKTIKVRVKPAWGDTKSYEDMTETLSTTATIIGRTLYRLFKGSD